MKFPTLLTAAALIAYVSTQTRLPATPATLLAAKELQNRAGIILLPRTNQ